MTENESFTWSWSPAPSEPITPPPTYWRVVGEDEWHEAQDGWIDAGVLPVNQEIEVSFGSPVYQSMRIVYDPRPPVEITSQEGRIAQARRRWRSFLRRLRSLAVRR